MRSRISIAACVAVACTLPALAETNLTSRFFGWEDLRGWSRQASSNLNERVWLSDVCQTTFRWDELVASWNAVTPDQTGLKIEARGLYDGHITKFYVMGLWSSKPSSFPRESVRRQKDADGDVLTDTLILAKPCQQAQLRVTLVAPTNGIEPQVRFIGLSLSSSNASVAILPPNKDAWGKTLDVPQKSQLNYAGGESAWCSPTSVSMVLGYWAKILNRPELDLDVPSVVDGVNDPAWPGTGNWPFNTAFVGSMPGMRAYVARLSDVSELEDWIAAGAPVVVSVAYDRLRRKPEARPDDGHLLVCVGFTADGDMVVNDPGTRNEIRRVFPRADVAAAWAASRHTVYLIHHLSTRPPHDRFGHWHQ